MYNYIYVNIYILEFTVATLPDSNAVGCFLVRPV